LATETKTKGFYGWWLLFFLWIVYTIPIGFAYYSPAVIYPFMIQGMGWSRGEIMVGAMALMLLFGISAPLNAWMIRRFGARVTLATGGIIVVVASTLMGLLGHIYSMFIVLSLFIGLGAALASMIPCQMVIISWFNARRAMAMGLVLGGGAIGGFLAPQLISAVIRSADGNWRVGWFIIAAASIAGIITALATVRNYPSDMGQYPDGLTPCEGETVVRASGRVSQTYRTPVDWTVRDAVRSRSLWLLIVAVVFSAFVWQVIVTQGPLHLQDRGFDPGMAAFFYSLAIGLSIVGRFTIAALGDIIEPRYLFAGGIFFILLGGILFWFVSPAAMWMAYIYPLLAGFGFGLTYICLPTIIGNYWGASAFAGIRGIDSPIELAFAAIVAPVAGFFYDLQGSYLTVLIISLIAGVVGLVAILLCTPPKPKELGTTEEAI
jgi:MFS family permease